MPCPALVEQRLLGSTGGGRRSGGEAAAGRALSPQAGIQHGVLPAPKRRQVALVAHAARTLIIQARTRTNQGASFCRTQKRGMRVGDAAAGRRRRGSRGVGAAEQLVRRRCTEREDCCARLAMLCRDVGSA